MSKTCAWTVMLALAGISCVADARLEPDAAASGDAPDADDAMPDGHSSNEAPSPLPGHASGAAVIPGSPRIATVPEHGPGATIIEAMGRIAWSPATGARPAARAGLEPSQELPVAAIPGADMSSSGPRLLGMSTASDRRPPGPVARWHEGTLIPTDWQSNVNGAVAVGQRIALTSASGVALLDPATGQVVRERRIGTACSELWVPGPELLVSVCGRQVIAFDSRTLAERWRMPLPDFTHTMTMRHDLLVATFDYWCFELADCQPPEVIALEASGHERWRVRSPAEYGFHITEDRARIYGHGLDATVWALDRATGATLWTATMAANIDGLVALDDGSLAVSHANGVDRVDGASGHRIAVLVDHPVAGMAVRGSWLVTVEGPRDRQADFRASRLRARDLATGRSWTYRRPIEGPIEIGDDLVYARTPTGTVHAIDLASGKGFWWVPVDGACEVLSVGTTAIAHVGGGAVILSAAANRAPWVTIHGAFADHVGDVGVRGHRVWIGDKVVRTDARGRFQSTVRRAPRIPIRIDPRDVAHGPQYDLDLAEETTIEIAHEEEVQCE